MTNEKLWKPFKNAHLLFDIRYILEEEKYYTLVGYHVK